MIKICKYLYVHWLFLVLFVFCYFNRSLENMMLSYLIIFVHELSHLAMAKLIGLEISNMTVYPFGMNLKLKNTIIYSLSEEIILYLAGPLSNIIMALVSLFAGIKGDFYYKNIVLFLLNILPIVPLDGGMIMKKMLNYYLGYNGGNKAMKYISVSFLAVILTMFSIILYYGSFNPSLIIFIVFILGNIIFSKEKYDTNLLKELLYAREKKDNKKISKAQIIEADISSDSFEIARYFRPKKKCFVVFIDKENKVKKIKSKEEIIEEILNEAL